jgi:hypothetical protein
MPINFRMMSLATINGVLWIEFEFATVVIST